MNSACFAFGYWIIAAFAIFFYTRYCFEIHLDEKNLKAINDIKDGLNGHKGMNRIPMLIHQYWFNGIGALAGWVVLWILLPKAWDAILHHKYSFNIGDFAMLLIALTGITGYLPLTLAAIAHGGKSLIEMVK